MLPRHYLYKKQRSDKISKNSINTPLIEPFEDSAASSGQSFKLRDYMLTLIFINWFLGGFACAYYISTTPFSVMDFKLIAISIVFGIYGFVIYKSPY